jgi:hypothetical protein
MAFAIAARLRARRVCAVGWFVIACISGFVGCSVWRRLEDNARFISAFFAFTMLSLGLVLWAWRSYGAETYGQVVDALQDGRVARFVLGLVLGVGAALVLAERAHVYPGDGGPGRSEQQSEEQFSAGTYRNLHDSWKAYLPYPLTLIGLGIVMLALLAPHLDDWLRRATAVKSPYIELQLVGTTSHKVSVSESLEAFYDVDALNYLTQYEGKIRRDVDYQELLKTQGKGNDAQARERETYLALTKELLPAFYIVVTPVAKCIQAAITQQSVSIDSVRDAVRPLANIAEQVVLSENLAHDRQQLEDTNRKFWLGVIGLPNKLGLETNTPDCHVIPHPCGDAIVCLDDYPIDMKVVFPLVQDYKDLPYLYVATALLISFTADDDRALQVLEKVDDAENADGTTCSAGSDANCDYVYLWILAMLNYYQGRPGDIWHAYLEPLDRLVKVARSRIEFLQSTGQRCQRDSDRLCRQQIAELTARNLAAYFIAEDAARGYADAKQHLTQLQEDTEEIKRLVDRSDEHLRNLDQNPLDKELQDARDNYLDTYAFATLVIEAQKPDPDYNLIRSKVIPTLNRAIHHFEADTELKEHGAPQERHIDRDTLAQWRTMQEHLAAAQEFVGER